MCWLMLDLEVRKNSVQRMLNDSRQIASASQTATTGKLCTFVLTKTFLLSTPEVKSAGPRVRRQGSTAQPSHLCAGSFSLEVRSDCGNQVEKVSLAYVRRNIHSFFTWFLPRQLWFSLLKSLRVCFRGEFYLGYCFQCIGLASNCRSVRDAFDFRTPNSVTGC